MMFFLIHNIFVKTSLIMSSGIIEKEYKTNVITNMGGIIKACPVLSTMFFISAMSLAGIPPLSGFWSKLFIFQSTFKNENYISLLIAICVSLFTLFSMLKIWRYAFCEESSKKEVINFRLSNNQLIAITPLILIPIIMGLFPDYFINTITVIADQMSNPDFIKNKILGDMS